MSTFITHHTTYWTIKLIGRNIHQSNILSTDCTFSESFQDTQSPHKVDFEHWTARSHTHFYNWKSGEVIYLIDAIVTKDSFDQLLVTNVTVTPRYTVLNVQQSRSAHGHPVVRNGNDLCPRVQQTLCHVCSDEAAT